MIHVNRRPLLAALLAACLPVMAQNAPQPPLPTISLNAGFHVIRAEVAQLPGERMVGLMQRKAMGANEGMLFVHDEAATQCFWMKNTVLPLSIAFIADDGRIVNIADMQPLSEDNHCSAGPVRYALEMNQGWFAKRGIKAGSRLSGRPFTH